MPREKKVTSRYGIAEWYGQDIEKLTPENRKTFSNIALSDRIENSPVCPYLSNLLPGAKCNKQGGVCSIRPYSSNPDGIVIADLSKKISTVCPSRFIGAIGDHASLFSWISKTMLGVNNPIIIKETPFLRNLTAISEIQEVGDKSPGGTKAGRIDWLIVNPASLELPEIEWCAIETQALYFSGDAMDKEFIGYASSLDGLLFPVGKRRPDYRSSGPKRLSPQLDVKVPLLRSWGKKLAVVIDRYFFEQMAKLEDAYPRAKNDQERRDNADVIWFVVDYNENLNLVPVKTIFTSLDSSRQALNAAEPLSKPDFTKDLRKLLLDKGAKVNKVFRTFG